MYGGASFVFGLRMVVRRNRDRDARSVSVSPRVNCSAGFVATEIIAETGCARLARFSHTGRRGDSAAGFEWCDEPGSGESYRLAALIAGANLNERQAPVSSQSKIITQNGLREAGAELGATRAQRPALDARYTKRALPAERKMKQQRPEFRAKNKGQQPDGANAGGEAGQFGISSLFNCRALDVHL